MTKKNKKYLSLAISLLVAVIIFSIFWAIGVKLGIIDTSWLPVFFTVFFLILVPFILVAVLTVHYGKKYSEKKKILTLYEKTFGLIDIEAYELNEAEVLMYQNSVGIF